MESTLAHAHPLVKTGPTLVAPPWALAALMFVLLAGAFVGAVLLAAR